VSELRDSDIIQSTIASDFLCPGDPAIIALTDEGDVLVITISSDQVARCV